MLKHYNIDFAMCKYGACTDFPWHELSISEILAIKECVENALEFEKEKKFVNSIGNLLEFFETDV